MSGICQVHGEHRPLPLMLHVHHVMPLGMQGGDIASNQVTVCPTGHFNIHAVLAAIVFGKPVPRASRQERHLAHVGYQMWLDAGKPGNPHAAYGLPEHPA